MHANGFYFRNRSIEQILAIIVVSQKWIEMVNLSGTNEATQVYHCEPIQARAQCAHNDFVKKWPTKKE